VRCLTLVPQPSICRSQENDLHHHGDGGQRMQGPFLPIALRHCWNGNVSGLQCMIYSLLTSFGFRIGLLHIRAPRIRRREDE
jgi:hypothetical protein